MVALSDKSRAWRVVAYSPLVVAACNFCLAMLVFTLSRLFFCYVNADFLGDISASRMSDLCRAGLRFDLTALLYLNSLYLLLELLPLQLRANDRYQHMARFAFWIPNLVALLINTIDTVYFRFTDRRTTCTFFREFENDGNLAHIFFESVVQYWYVTLFFIMVAALLVLLTRKRVELPALPSALSGRIAYYTVGVAVMCVSVYFIVIGIRGGFGRYTRPLTISNAMQYVDRPQETAVVLNTPFTLMMSLETPAYTNPHYFSDQQLETVYSPVHVADTTGTMRQLNVVVIILESFSKEFVGYYNRQSDGSYSGYTPFLDSLIANAFSCRYSYATGRKSIDAMPSVLSSIPMLIEPYVLTPYSTNAVASLASCLRPLGYATAFYHGAPNGSMGFQAYAHSVGFESYCGMDEYRAFPGCDADRDFDGTWAIWDEEFLQYYARSMSELPEPFCTAVFTASSHHPFRVPKRYEGVFPEGTQPLHQCIGYSDHALRRFFMTARQQPWFNNTLFVITADHTNQLSRAEYTNAKGLYEVPIIFYCPADSLVGETLQPVSQVDIMPSVLTYLRYPKSYIAFGQDAVTETKHTPFVVNYNNPYYQIISDRYLLQFDGQHTVAVYDIQADPCLERNIVDNVDSTETEPMLTYLKAYIQQYVSRMIDNRLVE